MRPVRDFLVTLLTLYVYADYMGRTLMPYYELGDCVVQRAIEDLFYIMAVL